jgi:putative nucleotidyltransferase with HDIG domain
MKTTHLVKRAVSSLLQTPPNPQDIAAVSQVLNTAEFAVWSDMQYRDQRHSIVVLRRFDVMASTADKMERAAALLHDVGKNISNLGFVSRVIATVVGPHGQRFIAYHDHERLGAELLRSISDPRTVALVGGLVDDDISLLLKAADDI